MVTRVDVPSRHGWVSHLATTGGCPISRLQGFLTKTGVARKEPPKTPADAADIAYAQRVVDDPDTEWVDWGDIKRELADPGRLGASPGRSLGFPKVARRRVESAIDSLSEQPLQGQQLSGGGGVRRLRVGDYRILYVVGEDVISIVRVDHRGRAYRKR